MTAATYQESDIVHPMFDLETDNNLFHMSRMMNAIHRSMNSTSIPVKEDNVLTLTPVHVKEYTFTGHNHPWVTQVIIGL